MASMRIVCALLGLMFCVAAIKSAYAQSTTLLFAFGDSYADTGNRPKSGPNVGKGWIYPYGITWPGTPAGRYSDGKLQTDWFADLVHLKYPPPYLFSAGQDTSSGVNFAVAGSGITPVNHEIALGAQIDNFELFLRTDPYSKVALANSLTLVSVVGNDYTGFPGATSAQLFVFIEQIVAGIQTNLQRLYNLGLRNVMVSNLGPLGCYPLVTIANNYQTCISTFNTSVQIHNAFLQGAIQTLNAQNSGANFIILDQNAAFSQLIQQAVPAGFRNKLTPCCPGTTNTSSCGDYDASGRWLFTVCKRREWAIFWDNYHPTMWAWNYIIGLYLNSPSYILEAKGLTLSAWLNINNLAFEPVAAPSSFPSPSTALGEIDAALRFLLYKPNYSDILGLLQSSSLEASAGNTLAAPITIFLPNNAALALINTTYFDSLLSANKENEVALYHAVPKYYDLNTILTEHPSNVTTLTGQSYPITIVPGNVLYVGLNNAAKIVDPNLYVVPGEIVIHGIDHVLIPPELA